MIRRTLSYLLVAAAVLAVAAFTGFHTDHDTIRHAVGAGVSLAFAFPVVPRSYDDLLKIGRPVNAGEPEAIPGVLFDTLTWLAAGVPKGLKFFQQAAPATNLSNVTNGKLDAGYAFQVYSFKCDLMRVPTAGAAATAAGALNDIDLLLKSNQAFFIFSQNNKPWPAIPLTFAHASGGATGNISYTLAAPGSFQFGNSGVFDDGFTSDGSLVILPQVPFSVTVAGIDPAVALAADLVIRFNLQGTLYRPVS